MADGKRVNKVRLSIEERVAMTECERLIQEGVFTEDFFKEEVRCDFLVTPERKKLWAIQIDLLQKLLDVCKRHNLRCYALFGTLLGAVRHKGFIPWDDDIDVGMPREDYEKLWEYRDEFPHPYFLQYPGRDHDYCVSFAKLRNSNTTQISKNFMHHAFNSGIVVDIFPLDAWDATTGEKAYDRIKELNIDNSNYLRRGHPEPDEAMKKRIAQWSGTSPKENLREIDRLATQYRNDSGAEYWTTVVCTLDPYERIMYRNEWFGEITELPFENILIPVPKQYLRLLELGFGNWQEFPPVEQRGLWHSDLICDTDRPYTSYINSGSVK